MKSTAAIMFLKQNPNGKLVSAKTQAVVTKDQGGFKVTDIDGTANLLNMAQFQMSGANQDWLDKDQLPGVQGDEEVQP